jgi:hypothetical protein
LRPYNHQSVLATIVTPFTQLLNAIRYAANKLVLGAFFRLTFPSCLQISFIRLRLHYLLHPPLLDAGRLSICGSFCQGR